MHGNINIKKKCPKIIFWKYILIMFSPMHTNKNTHQTVFQSRK